MTSQGMLASMTAEGPEQSRGVESPTDGEVFLAYLEQVLPGRPGLRPGRWW